MGKAPSHCGPAIILNLYKIAHFESTVDKWELDASDSHLAGEATGLVHLRHALRNLAISQQTNSITRRIGVISACGAVVIACRTDGSGTNAHGHATAHIGSASNAAMIDAAGMDTAYAATATATASR
jgi:hypothetical protein